MLILGIETSCDETACALLEDGSKVLSSIIGSSLPLHKRFGGVVPEIACRAHVESITHILDEALRKAGVGVGDIDLVAVTYGPGLVGALLIGISAAKAIAFSHSLPLVGVNHLEAHLEANLLGQQQPDAPLVGLVVSGGHTSLVYKESPDSDYRLLGRTRDDAVGEAFDKVSKILGLGYPGGPAIDKSARRGDPKKIRFPRANMSDGGFDFSFSGIKTAVLYYVRDHGICSSPPEASIADIAASFQEAVVEDLVDKTLKAVRTKKARSILIGGGVASNSRLRERLVKAGAAEDIDVYFPKGQLCTDNASMVASLGWRNFKRGLLSDFSLTAEPNLGFGIPKNADNRG